MARKLSRNILDRIHRRAHIIANGDSEYAAEIQKEYREGWEASREKGELYETILDLVEMGLLFDTGQRRGGRILWAAIEHMKRH